MLKFLSGEVEDPLFHEVFAKINSDESRHLAIGFAVMDMLGTRKFSRMLVEDVAPLLKPVTIVRAVGLANPMLSGSQASSPGWVTPCATWVSTRS